MYIALLLEPVLAPGRRVVHIGAAAQRVQASVVTPPADLGVGHTETHEARALDAEVTRRDPHEHLVRTICHATTVRDASAVRTARRRTLWIRVPGRHVCGNERPSSPVTLAADAPAPTMAGNSRVGG